MQPAIGLGFRRELVDFIRSDHSTPIQFLELAPENWMGVGGYWREILRDLSKRFPFTSHGLSLSIGSPEPLDLDHLCAVKAFLDEFHISLYSEHLSFSRCDNAHLYDLLPIPFRREAVRHIVPRIKRAQDILERPIVLENISYYCQLAAEMPEQQFISEILEAADCKLLLDVNNVFVNASNHGYDPFEFIDELPLQRVAYLHVAGHDRVSDDLIVDSHGSPVIEDVFTLLRYVLDRIPPVPILLERDFNFDDETQLMLELQRVSHIAQTDEEASNAA